MNTDLLKAASIPAVLALLGGCAAQSALEQSNNIKFGENTRQTFMAQVIDPEPVYDDPVPVADGEVGAAAVERYRTDQVKEPETTSVGGSSSSGSGSSSSSSSSGSN